MAILECLNADAEIGVPLTFSVEMEKSKEHAVGCLPDHDVDQGERYGENKFDS